MTTLIKKINDMSPEFRKFVIGSEIQAKLGAADVLLKAMPDRLNPSGTAKTLDSIMSKMTGSTLGIAGMVLDPGNPLGFILGPMARYLGREAPDSAKLAMLKYLGSGQKIESEGFKAMADFIQHTIDGENMIRKSAGAIFDAAKVMSYTIPSDAKIEKLDKKVEEYALNPGGLLDVGGKSGYYMPNHGQSMGQTAAQTVGYLASLKPHYEKKSPLDPDFKDPIKEEKYKRALTIAEQPLVVLEDIKKGTLTGQDVVHLKTMYPALYEKLQKQVYDNIVNATEKGKDIPYPTRTSLSLFMGTALDSTLTPQAIMMNQPKPEPVQQSKPPTKSAGEQMVKVADMYKGPLQKSQARHGF